MEFPGNKQFDYVYITMICILLQSKKAVSAYLTRNQMLPFVFARQTTHVLYKSFKSCWQNKPTSQVNNDIICFYWRDAPLKVFTTGSHTVSTGPGCPPGDSGLRLSTLPLGQGGSSQHGIFETGLRKNILFLRNLKTGLGGRICELRLDRGSYI